jgi:NAD-dependent dihydropyrimidine dehydrogenase PreA subunit
MSYYIADSICISCGACEFVCETLAIKRREDTYRGTFVIDPMLCFDCGLCVKNCPVDCIYQDPESIICHGRGCPLNAKSAMKDWECSELKQLCKTCGNVLWRKPGEQQWFCFSCDSGKGLCPKVKAAQKPGYAVPVINAKLEPKARAR